MPRTLLLDSMGSARFRLDEDAAAKGKVRLIGTVGWCDKPTKNGRTYPRSVMEREIAKLNKRAKAKRVYQEADHPADGKTKYQRVAGAVDRAWIEESGEIKAEMTVLDTTRGQDIKAIALAGYEIGTSSRGWGSTVDKDGGQLVQEDYDLTTFDFVCDPAADDAYPSVQVEETEREDDPMPDSKTTEPAEICLTAEDVEARARQIAEERMTEERTALARKLEEAKEAAKVKLDEALSRRVAEREAEIATAHEGKLTEAVKVREAALREEFGTALLETREEMEAKLRGEITEQLLDDPKVAGAKKALVEVVAVLRDYVMEGDAAALVESKNAEIEALKVRLTEKEAEIGDRDATIAKLERAARKAGYTLFVERELAGTTDSDKVVGLLGDLSDFDSLEELKTRIAEVSATLEEAKAEAKPELTEEQQVVLDEAPEVSERVKELEKKLAEADTAKAEALEQAEKATKIAGNAALIAAKATALRDNPRRAGLAESLQAAKTMDDVKRIVAESPVQGAPAGGSSLFERIQDRVHSRGRTRPGSVEETEEAGKPSPVRGTGAVTEELADIGVKVAEVKSMMENIRG